MKIAMVSEFIESVPPKKYGGTELVVYNLVETLVALGHDVTLFASKDSKTSAKLVPIVDKSLRSMKLPTDKHENAYRIYGAAKIAGLLQKEKFDVVHNHIGWRFLTLEHLIQAPIITTVHGPLSGDYWHLVYGFFKKSNFASISFSQRKPYKDLNFVATVYNGIAVEKFKYSESPQDYFAFLGRMSPEKGPVQAIQIAKQAGVNLVMAAKVDTADAKFFNEQVKPLIDDKQIKFIGEVDHPGKVKLLSGAKGLIAPIQWEEPFGLFFTEAMACGTPVIAMNRGSVPEIVVDGKTGFICKDNNEAVAAVRKIGQIKRKDCRAHVEKKFSNKQMALGYLEAYKKISKKKSWLGW